jgi:ABC-type multidrug transport system fused ATPase/permease subunit
MPTPKNNETDTVSNEWNAGCFSRWTFSWLFPLIRLGYKRHLTEEDIGDNMPRDQVETYLVSFEEHLSKGSPGTIRRTIWNTFSHHEWMAVACKVISIAVEYVPPICISYIIGYAEDPDSWGDRIFIAAAAMLVAEIVKGLCNHWFYQFVMIDGLHARTTIQSAVYSKLLRISNAARTRSSKEGGVADTITNLQSTDCRAIEMVYWMWMYLWAAPLQVLITTILMYYQIGWTVLVGIAVLVFMIPVQKSVLKYLKSLTKAASEASDTRIKLLTEIIHGVQV